MVNGMVNFTLYRSDTLATPTATMIAQEPATYSLYKNAVVRYTKKRKEIMIFFIITFQGPRTRNQTKQLPMDMEKKKRNEKNEENFVPIFFSSTLSIVPPLTKPRCNKNCLGQEENFRFSFHFGSFFPSLI